MRSLGERQEESSQESTPRAGNTASASVTVSVDKRPPPNLVFLTPSSLALVVDEPRQLSLVDDNGRQLTGATWTVSDTSVVEVTTEGGIILTGRAEGEALVTATWQEFAADALVTVYPGPELAQGTIRWSVQPMPGYSTAQIVQAQPAGEDTPDLYSIETGADGVVVRAPTSDGRQMWLARPGSAVASTQTAAASSSTSSSTAQAASLGWFYWAYPDAFGGLLLWFEDLHSLALRLNGATGLESWTYASKGWLYEDWAVHPDGTIYVTEWADILSDNLAVIAIDGQTGARLARMPLPPSYGGQRNRGCVPGNDDVYTYPSTPGPPIIAPDGSVYLEVELNTWIYDDLPCAEGGSNVYDSTVGLLEFRPDGSTAWHDIKQFSFEGYVDFQTMTLPHAAAGEVIPDGQGGLLVGWTYHEIDPIHHPDPELGPRVTRLSASGNSEYSLPFRGQGTWTWEPARSLVLGEEGVAFAGVWQSASGSTGDLAKAAAFDVASGAVEWTWETPGWWIDLIAAISGNGLVGKGWLEDGTQRVV